MIDLAYIIESADVRLPNACPELPDMETVAAPKGVEKKCVRCGAVFYQLTGRPTDYCRPCRRLNQLDRQKKNYHLKKHPANEAVKKRIIETCRQAEKEGISYGKMVQRRYL